MKRSKLLIITIVITVILLLSSCSRGFGKDTIGFGNMILKIPFKVVEEGEGGYNDFIGYFYRSKHLNSNYTQEYCEIVIVPVENYTEEDYQKDKTAFENLTTEYQSRELIELNRVSDYYIRNNKSHKVLIVYYDAPALYGGILFEPEKQTAYKFRFSGIQLQDIISIFEYIEFSE